MKLTQRLALEIIILTLAILGFDLLVKNYLFFHVIVELFSIVILFVLFAITWNARRVLDNRYLLFVGIAAIFIGILDLLHTLTYKGMNIIPSPLYYANQFWVATRFFESAVLLTGFIFLTRKFSIKIKYLLLIYTAITLSIILSILYFENFPVCYIEGVGQTPFKIGSEYVIISILIISLMLLLKNKKHFENDTYVLIITSIILTIASEFSFTLYVANYDYINKLGHAFKVLSFYMIYKANIENGFNKPIVTFFREIKISEEKIKESNQELEKQIATKNKFFSIISHDLKNPFTVILGFSEMLLKNNNTYKELEREKYLKAIYNTSENTYKLLENLLSWARIQTNSFPIKPLRFDIKTVLDQSISLSNANLKEIEIVKNYTTEWVFADIDMVNTVTRNLLSNAVKYTSRYGKVFISAVNERSNVIISIQDTGVGISEEKLNMLFKTEKIFSTKGTENEAGTGLGLLLCYEFVTKNNGQIFVESKLQEGSKFTFSLPASV